MWKCLIESTLVCIMRENLNGHATSNKVLVSRNIVHHANPYVATFHTIYYSTTFVFND